MDMTTLFGPAQVTSASAEQSEGILRLQRGAIERLPAGLYDPAVQAAWWRTPTRGLEELIAAGHYYVLAVDGYLVAGAGWSPGEAPHSGLLRAVYTDPEFAGLGFGRRVVLHAEAAARAEGMQEMVVPAVRHAEGFYARLGYVPGAAAELELEDGARLPYRIMTKELTG